MQGYKGGSGYIAANEDGNTGAIFVSGQNILSDEVRRFYDSE